MTDPKSSRAYSTEEAASIITRVLERQSGEGGRISHDELLETARDIGVTTLELEEAVVAETRARAERIVRDEERQRDLRKLLRYTPAPTSSWAPSASCWTWSGSPGASGTSGSSSAGCVVVALRQTVKVFLPTEGPDRRLAAGKKTVEARDGKLQIGP